MTANANRSAPGERDLASALAELGLRTVARWCADCGRYAEHGLVVRLVHSASGPSFEVVACLPCARIRSAALDAPGWLREDLARLDTAPAWLRDALEPMPLDPTLRHMG